MDLIIYDGVCVLCSRSVRFVAARDTAGRFGFVPAQSPYGQQLMAKHGIDALAAETFIAIIDGQALVRSEGALAVLARLPRYGFARWLRLIPRPLRDAVYDLIARHRYSWFGRFATCPMPPAWLRARVLEREPPA